MAVNLTTPEAVPDIQYQGITKIDFDVPHYLDGSDMKLNKPDIRCIVTVATWAGDGTQIREERFQVFFPDWPGVFTADVQTIYSRIEAYAESEGYIGAGTPEAL